MIERWKCVGYCRHCSADQDDSTFSKEWGHFEKSSDGAWVRADSAQARIAQLEAALRWYAKARVNNPTPGAPFSNCDDGMYARQVLGSALETPVKSRPSFSGWIQAPCWKCGKSSKEHSGVEMWCPMETACDHVWVGRSYAMSAVL